MESSNAGDAFRRCRRGFLGFGRFPYAVYETLPILDKRMAGERQDRVTSVTAFWNGDANYPIDGPR